MNIKDLLKPYIDLNYKTFNEKICSTNLEILGVKIPILRKISKNLLKEYNYKDIIKNIDNNIFEETIIEAFIIANANISYNEKITLIKIFLNKIDNWSICDLFVNELKFIKNNHKDFINFLRPIFNSNKEFYLRFAIVTLNNYYIDNNYLDFVLNKLLEIKSDHYYVKMAISWCLTTCLSKDFSKTYNFLKINKNNFDKWTFNKCISKVKDSYLISNENKQKLINLK